MWHLLPIRVGAVPVLETEEATEADSGQTLATEAEAIEPGDQLVHSLPLSPPLSSVGVVGDSIILPDSARTNLLVANNPGAEVPHGKDAR